MLKTSRTVSIHLLFFFGKHFGRLVEGVRTERRQIRTLQVLFKLGIIRQPGRFSDDRALLRYSTHAAGKLLSQVEN